MNLIKFNIPTFKDQRAQSESGSHRLRISMTDPRAAPPNPKQKFLFLLLVVVVVLVVTPSLSFSNLPDAEVGGILWGTSIHFNSLHMAWSGPTQC